jgi:nitronate monooxygenase
MARALVRAEVAPAIMTSRSADHGKWRFVVSAAASGGRTRPGRGRRAGRYCVSMQTWLTETLGVTVPVVCAPMAGVANGPLASAVSTAGGLGMIGVGARTDLEWIAEQGRIATASGRPFGVGLQAWVLERNPAQLEAALAIGPALISVSYGPYPPYAKRIQQAGIPMATTVGTLAEARAAAEAGVDVIVARGAEGGGHGRDQVATLPLLEAVLDLVSVPVLAAGGIASARGLAAVIAAGAAGGWVGTAFLTCVEGMGSATAHARLIAATDTDTVYGRVFDLGSRAGWPTEFGERALRNQFFDRWVGREAELATDAEAVAGFAEASAAQNFDVACLDAGQGVALLTAERTAAEVVAEFAGAGERLRQAGQVAGLAASQVAGQAVGQAAGLAGSQAVGQASGQAAGQASGQAAGQAADGSDRGREFDRGQDRDRDSVGRARQARPRDALGRPLPYGDPLGVEPVPEEALPPEEALTLAEELLAAGRAFSAHEVLEAVWKAAPEAERDLWQGMAQICVGITHAHRGNGAGAARLVQRGAGNLRGYAGQSPHGIDVNGLLQWCEQNAPDPAAALPRLRCGPDPA